ncbi:MAG TPA: XylR family transcriptional regulator [Kiritimatiellia bacterium]|nr:XylR family transcriptional regulator [Kiritimatiellia bacterium]HRU70081.1 XylR family transcriptional regulator [Kiritimatiellia bacterium]
MVKQRSRVKKVTRHKIPQVAILLESSHEISRGMIRGILAYVRLYGPWALHLESGGWSDQKLPDLNVWHGNGIIARVPSSKVAADVAAARLPTVLIDPIDDYLDPKHPLSRYSRIECDSAEVARLAADYYLASGFTRFAFVGEPSDVNWSRRRQAAFVRRLDETGHSCAIYPSPNEAERDNWEIERLRMSRWLRKLPKPIAVFAANDARGRQVLNACLAADLPVPYEIAVLGVNNDVMICETSLPPLSSVAVDMEQAGYAAAELLDHLMRKTQRGQQCVLFKPQEVVARASTQRLQVNDRLVIRALEYIRINAGLNIRVSDVASHVGVTPRWLEKRFAHTLARSVMDEIQRVRMDTVNSLVTKSDLSFAEIARRCGFTSANHLGVLFRQTFGTTMSEFRQQKGR